MSLVRKFKLIVLLFTVSIFPSLSMARTWLVNADGTGEFTVIQDAVDAAAPGDTISIGSGWYQEYQEYISPPARRYVDVSYKEVLTLIGAGASQTIIGPIVLDPDINRRNYGIYGVFGLVSLVVKDLKIVNMNWKGLVPFDALIRIINCDFVNCRIGIHNEGLDGSLIEGCRFEDCYNHGIIIAPPTTGLIVRDCQFINCELGFGFHWSGVQDCEVLNCSITGGYFGGQFDEGASGLVRDCYFYGQERACMIFARSGLVRLENNWIEQVDSDNMYAGALSFTDSSDVHGEGNTVISTESCFLFNGIPKFNLQNNHFLRNGPDAWYARVSEPFSLPEDHVDLSGNYWGTDDPHEISTWIYDAYDSEEISLWVDFMPILTEPVVGVDPPRLVQANQIKVWPNPFNPQTTIEFSLANEGRVKLAVYDLRGRLVAELLNGLRLAGSGSFLWDGRDTYGSAVASGVYIARLETADGVQTRKLVVAR